MKTLNEKTKIKVSYSDGDSRITTWKELKEFWSQETEVWLTQSIRNLELHGYTYGKVAKYEIIKNKS